MNDGHTVVGIDGLKIEPLPPQLSGVDAHGERVPFEPVRDIASLYEELDERAHGRASAASPNTASPCAGTRTSSSHPPAAGAARAVRACIGGVRFGGTLDHRGRVGAGLRPHRALRRARAAHRDLDMPNGLARGVRTASDFLMALQLTGAAKNDSHRQPAGAPAGGGDRRRPDRHRHRHRGARLLPGAGREVPVALRDAGRPSAATLRCAPAGAKTKARSPTSSSRMPARSAPSATQPAAKAARRASPNCSTAGAASPSPIAAA